MIPHVLLCLVFFVCLLVCLRNNTQRQMMSWLVETRSDKEKTKGHFWYISWKNCVSHTLIIKLYCPCWVMLTKTWLHSRCLGSSPSLLLFEKMFLLIDQRELWNHRFWNLSRLWHEYFWQSNHFSFVLRHLFVFAVFVPGLLLCSVVCLCAPRARQDILKAFLFSSHWVYLSTVPSDVNKHDSKVFEELCDIYIYWHSIDDQKGIMLSSKKAPRAGLFLNVYEDIRGREKLVRN